MKYTVLEVWRAGLWVRLVTCVTLLAMAVFFALDSGFLVYAQVFIHHEHWLKFPSLGHGLLYLVGLFGFGLAVSIALAAKGIWSASRFCGLKRGSGIRLVLVVVPEPAAPEVPEPDGGEHLRRLV